MDKKKVKAKKKTTAKKRETHRTIKVRIFTFKEFLIRLIVILIVSLVGYITLFALSDFSWEIFATSVNCFTVGLIQTSIIGFGFKLF